MPGAEPFAKLDALYERYLPQQCWQQAVQNRMQAASFAHMRGRTDLFRQYIQQAIDLAQAHDLERLELDARITRFTYLLISDLTGHILDELPGELTIELTATGAELTGASIDQLNRYEAGALAAYDAVLASPNPDSIKLAREKAAAFLVYLSGQFDEAAASESIRQAALSARSETARICAALRVDLFLLAAELRRKRGDPDTAGDLFRKAEQLSETLPEKRCKVYMAWADFCDGRARLKLAIDYATKAVEAAAQISSAALQAQAQGKLNNLVARGKAEAPASGPLPGSGATDRVMWILENAHQALLARSFEDSQKLCDRAIEQASSPALRRAVLRERAIAWYELRRLEDAERDLDECISLLAAELSSDAAVAAGAFDSRTKEEEGFYLMKAFLRAKAGKSLESWNIAEQGRSRRLKREIALQDSSFSTVRAWLRSERAAMLSFATTPWGTLALTAGPQDSEPQAQILAQFTGSDLKRLLGSDESPDDAIFKSIPGLSAGLIHPLSGRLRAITHGARVLYVIPDSFLHYAPFAALTLNGSPDSLMLLDLCPLAITPSSAILLWCASRRGAPSRDCLAIAAGRDSTGFEFHNHLTRIAAAPWSKPPVQLRDEAASAAAVAAQAPQYDVLYFSCHGSISPDFRGLMEASQLELAGKHCISAADVAKWKLRADLVFLNACQSGRFRLQARTDVNGFVRAFPLAGARSLIAPLIQVDPHSAGDLAARFFEAWLGGATKAEALRSAQIQSRNAGSTDWATYCLTGDFL